MTDSVNDRTISVFISYSYDDEDHISRVLQFAQYLQRNGLSVVLDQWSNLPGESLTMFMERSIRECEYTVVVCTPNYKKKSDGRHGGVGYEQQIITSYLAKSISPGRFIPVIFEGSFEIHEVSSAIPTQFSGIHAVDCRAGNFLIGAEKKRAALLGLSVQLPPQRNKSLDRIKAGENESRLPNLGLDGYEIVSGLSQSLLYSETFSIPTRSERDNEPHWVCRRL